MGDNCKNSLNKDNLVIIAQKYQKLSNINSHGCLVPNTDLTRIGTGVKLSDVNTELPLVIKDTVRSGHMGCFGTTGVGKTKLIENLVSQDIMKGYNVAVIDPKGDVELFSRIVQVAAEAGRLQEILMLTPIFPDFSIMLDPLSYYYMEDELVDHVVSGIKAKEDYYVSIGSEITHAIIEGQIVIARIDKRKPSFNFWEIKKKSDYVNLKNFRDILAQIEDTTELVENMDQILNSPPDYFTKVSSSLRTTLSALTSGSTGKIIGKAFHNEFIRRMEEGKGVIFYCNTGSLLTRRTAHTIGKVVVSMIQSLLGRFYASGRKLIPPLCVHMDEGHNILYRGVQELFNKGRGANVWLSLYTQSPAEIMDEIGKEATRSIIDNINTWIYMLINDPETAQHVEATSPMVKKNQKFVSVGGGITIKQGEERQIPAHMVLQLQPREFYMRSYGRLYKGFTDDVKPLYVEIKLPDIRVLPPEVDEKKT